MRPWHGRKVRFPSGFPPTNRSRWAQTGLADWRCGWRGPPPPCPYRSPLTARQEAGYLPLSQSVYGRKRSAGTGPPTREPTPRESEPCFSTSLNLYVRRRRLFSHLTLGECFRPPGPPHPPPSPPPQNPATPPDSRRAEAVGPSHSAPPFDCAAARRWRGRGRRLPEPRTAPERRSAACG